MLLFWSTPTALLPGHWVSRMLSFQWRAQNSHSRTSPNTKPDANTNPNANADTDTNPNINANTHSDSYAMRWEMLTDAKATSHPGTASVVCRDIIRKENGRWKLIENSLYTTKETIVTS